jgi:hypothetical protein
VGFHISSVKNVAQQHSGRASNHFIYLQTTACPLAYQQAGHVLATLSINPSLHFIHPRLWCVQMQVMGHDLQALLGRKTQRSSQRCRQKSNIADAAKDREVQGAQQWINCVRVAAIDKKNRP